MTETGVRDYDVLQEPYLAADDFEVDAKEEEEVILDPEVVEANRDRFHDALEYAQTIEAPDTSSDDVIGLA
jgi:hypothetical protein